MPFESDWAAARAEWGWRSWSTPTSAYALWSTGVTRRRIAASGAPAVRVRTPVPESDTLGATFVRAAVSGCVSDSVGVVKLRMVIEEAGAHLAARLGRWLSAERATLLRHDCVTDGREGCDLCYVYRSR